MVFQARIQTKGQGRGPVRWNPTQEQRRPDGGRGGGGGSGAPPPENCWKGKLRNLLPWHLWTQQRAETQLNLLWCSRHRSRLRSGKGACQMNPKSGALKAWWGSTPRKFLKMGTETRGPCETQQNLYLPAVGEPFSPQFTLSNSSSP